MQISYILIPLAIYLYSFEPYRKYILYHIICIGILGTYDTYKQYNKKQINNELDKKIIQLITLKYFYLFSFIIHLLCLLVLFHFFTYKNTNIICFLLLLKD